MSGFTSLRVVICLPFLAWLFLTSAGRAQGPSHQPPLGPGRPSLMQRYQTALQHAKEQGANTSDAENLATQSTSAIRRGDRNAADQLMRKAIETLETTSTPSQTHPSLPPPSQPTLSPTTGTLQPVFLLPFTHHYNGPGGYYPAAAEVRKMGEFFITNQIPGTLFFDGILVERLQQEDPSLIQQIRTWNLPLGYHGEETHGPYPVASELLGEVYTLKEAQGYQGPWSLTTGKDWDTAVKLVEERYSFSRPYHIDPTTHRIDRRQPALTDLSHTGGLKLVQQAFGKDVSMMTSHSLESAPEGFAFRRMSKFGFDQPAVPIALHALKIFRIGDVADQVMSISGENESIFWYMGRLHCKGDESGEAGGFRVGLLRHKLQTLDRTRPRLLLIGFSKVEEEEGKRTAQFLNGDFFPSNPGSGWVTGDTLTNHFEPEKGYCPTSADLMALARAVVANWKARPPDLLTLNGRTYSLCDTFEGLARALAYQTNQGKLPDTVELHASYGPVTEDGGALLRQPTSVSPSTIRTTTQKMLEAMERTTGDRFIPARLSVGNTEMNGAEFLYAMATALQAATNATILIPPSQLFPPYADLLQSVFKPKALQPLCYTKGQLWTVKPVRLKTSSPSPTPAISTAAPVPTSGIPKAIRIVFASNLNSEGGCQRDDPSGADLYSVEYNLETGKASELHQLTSRIGPEWFPVLSPDGHFVVYNRTTPPAPGSPARQALWQFDLIRGKEQLLVNEARFPAFDATGKALYYSQRVRQEHQILRAPLSLNSNGWLQLGPPQILADQSSGQELVEDPAPLPDNSAVVFHRKEKAQGAGVALIPTAGGPVQTLSDFDGCGHASVSPDGQAVACTRSRDGHLVIIRRSPSGWQAPHDLPVSGNVADYQADDDRFKTVREIRHSYVEWITPQLLLATTHGANGAKDFKFARLYLLILQGDNQPPKRVDLSNAIEALADRRHRDFCSASALPIQQ